MSTSHTDQKYRAPALEKGLDILELLSSTDTPMTMPMMARQLDRSKSEIFRMATVLEHRGYICRVEGTDTFVVTNRLFELGMRNPPMYNLVETSAPLMHKLTAEVDQSCHIAVASGEQIVVVFGVEAEGYLSFAVRIGHRQALLHSSSGRTLLAFQELHVQEQWLQYEKDESERARLRKQVAKIHKRGFEERSSELVNGIIDISVPLFDDKRSGATACLTMPLVKHLKLKEEQLLAIQLVKSTAAEISRLLSVGYEPDRDLG